MNNRKIYRFLQWTWGIFQNIIGYIVFRSCIRRHYPVFRFKNAYVSLWKRRDSASIGMFIFLGYPSTDILSHEYGHTIQSCILGPLYLPVIGLPSLIWCHSRRFNRNRQRGIYRYSDFYPERWANRLGEKYTRLRAIDY
ncbi:MAG: hypothetical protein IJL85_06950 [Erysipelotrichaceae bacterium]|nr:hypothetical protein [Erysipelotrichaceae bacterium]